MTNEETFFEKHYILFGCILLLCVIGGLLYSVAMLGDYRLDQIEKSPVEIVTITVLEKSIRSPYRFTIVDTNGVEYISFNENQDKPEAWHQQYFKFEEGEQITIQVKRIPPEQWWWIVGVVE